MTQDFAKKQRTPAQPKAKAHPHAQSGSPRWVWFTTGFFSGGFLAFLAALWFLVPTEHPAIESAKPVAEPEQKTEEMQWDFFEIFPKSVVPIVEEYTETGEKVSTEKSTWILQAGSFKSAKDADELRASLILMGLDVSISDVKVSGKTWHRVIVGPFETPLDRNRAQDKLAQAQIEAMAVRISP